MILFHVAGSLILPPALAALTVVDLRRHRLPDRLTLPLIAAGVLASAYDAGGVPVSSIMGAAVGYLVFAAIGAGYYRRRGVEGLGLGDAKLLAAGGAWLGVMALPFVVLGAALPALAVAVISGASTTRRIAFGPWLALAILVLWCLKVAGFDLGEAGVG